MAIDQLYIWNKAVGHCGHATLVQITDVTEQTDNALKCRLHWDSALLGFYEELWWSHLTSYVELSEEAAPTDVEGFWTKSYSYPADCATPRRILGADPAHTIPFEEGIDSEGDRVIWTDRVDAVLEYTNSSVAYSLWPGAVIDALALKLAKSMIPEFGGNLNKIQTLAAMYDDALERASVGSHNRQERHPEENESLEFQQMRHGSFVERKDGFILDG